MKDIDLLAKINADRDRAVRRMGGAWIYVSVDRKSGVPVNACGIWDSEQDALAAASCDVDADSTHYAVPIFLEGRYIDDFGIE